MNLHYLLRAERCPRSAALRHARYAELWDRNTYPDKPSVAGLAGTVVHATVARIVQQFSENGCTSIDDPRCSAVLKQLGGYTRILMQTITDLAKALAGNPRFEIVRDWSLVALQKRIPLLREHVQLQLGKISWPVLSQNNEQSAAPKDVCRHPSNRPALGKGVHFEVEVRYPKLKWRGVIDFLDVGEQSCTIKDFKTGEASDDHVLQLKLYALLWLNDRELNPAALPPSQLSVSYASGEQEVSIAPKELAELSESLLNRAAQVRASIDGPASRANVSNDNCPHCDVRHLCSDYWSLSRRSKAPAKGDASAVADDIQLELKARRGDKTWSAECLISNHFPPKTTLLLRWSLHNLVLLESLKPGMKVRLTGAMIFVDDSNECGIVNCVTNTDVIVLGI
ncbi:MAG TPA: PD-(D/E)XK nuclease family protein [Candidatus Sulfotelmatobacter sp.]|nr:PD-(D/E)XK nuclease family protein [Candidatus Sulfotelmatobacter sp.]